VTQLQSDVPDLAGQAWLSAAIGGGLPEPTRERWQPLRVGIVGLWEYDDAEFWFADGRLVLRGGNGAGKTKVLELTTLMLLRGEIAPSVLDPFGSQHRTMRYNLLPTGDGDDPRPPADAGLGYAWVEFGRRTVAGEVVFFACGMGASARRGSGSGGVTTWHFVTGLRPRKDFGLLAAGGALDRKALDGIDGVELPPSAAAYRATVARELYGLPLESYDTLTDLLKHLRKPKLGERLNPASLAETLRDALPPVAAQEVTQLAEGWERLEQLRRAVEQTERAATSVAHFARRGWRPWARQVLRQRADEAAAATTTLDNTTRDRSSAEKSLEAARSVVAAADGELAQARREQGDRSSELRELLESRAYQDAAAAAGRVEALRGEVRSRTAQLEGARVRAARAQGAVVVARRAAQDASDGLSAAGLEVGRAATEVTREAQLSGLDESARRHLPGYDVHALAADHQARTERLGRLRELHDEHDRRRQRADRSGDALERAETELSRARDDETAAAGRVVAAADVLERGIRDWAAAAEVTAAPSDTVDRWCAMVAGLTMVDAEQGMVEIGPSVVDAVRRRIAELREGLAERAERARSARLPEVGRLDELDAALAVLQTGAQAEPAAPASWRRRPRPDVDAGRGAPLWRLVNPAADVDGERLDRVEAALAAAGLLDAWVTPDGRLDREEGELVADVQVSSRNRTPGSTLLAVLTPDGAGGVPTQVVRTVLAGIGWSETADDEGEGDRLAADGSWRVGGLLGRAEPSGPASYLGAAAREAARERERTRLEAERSEVAGRIAVLDRELEATSEALARAAAEERALPVAAEQALNQAVVVLAERGRSRVGAQGRAAEAQGRHAQDLERRDLAWAEFADHAGAHRFALTDLRGQEEALRRFGSTITRLAAELRVLAARQEQAQGAQEQLTERDEAAGEAAADESRADEDVRRARVRLATAEQSLGQDQREHLDRRDRLDGEVRRLTDSIQELGDRLRHAEVAAANAVNVLDKHEESRTAAEQRRDLAVAALWAAVEAGLADALGLTPPDRRSVQATREFFAVVRRDLDVPADDGRRDLAWRTCVRELEALRQNLLPTRDAHVRDEDDGPAEGSLPGLPRVEVLVDPASGWQRPDLAADTLAERVREQRSSFDAEQQQVLTTLLESTFIEHLKDRLDYTTRTFARINDQLARHPTRRGHLVRVMCEADPADPDAGAVVAALGRGFGELTAERQTMVRAFLARRIDEAQAESSAKGVADWKDELARALDYRGWLKLSLHYRPGPGSAWAVFDAARHATKSGGEKVVLLSQPLFAAAVVAHDAAGPSAPRWVWLDEAMTGVDAAVKASFMGLTVDFDLDVMLTAHDEWCDYVTVPAVAVYDLARHEHLPGVDAVPYLWCGGTMAEVDVDRIGVAASGQQIPAVGLFADLGSQE
jgi:uncharacterized protein (TIGR02680 family)